MKKTILEVYGMTPVKVSKTKQNPDPCSNPDLVVGLELEIENISRGRDYYQDEAGGFWFVEEDGSLRPRGEAWEFISKPAPMGVALAEMRILFDRLKFTDDNYTDRCSVHVHTNVQDFTQEQLANLALVYPVVEGILFRYVNHYKKKEEQGYCRDTNLYCIPWSDCRMNRNFVQRFFDNPEAYVSGRRNELGSRQWEKYTALNFIPVGGQGTVEWRHMHGTADLEKLTTWMNVIGSIMKFCKENDFSDIVKTIKVLNDVSTYQQFFTAVLGDTLPYLDEYRKPMSEGVVNAKYSLVNWEVNKDKKKEPKARKSSLYARAYMDAETDAMPLPDDDWMIRPPQPTPAPAATAEQQFIAARGTTAGPQVRVLDDFNWDGFNAATVAARQAARPAPAGLAEELVRIRQRDIERRQREMTQVANRIRRPR